MNSSKIINDKIVRVSDILEQVDELNRMIEIHEGELGDNSMYTQYQYMKDEFVNELNNILKEFKLDIKAA